MQVLALSGSGAEFPNAAFGGALVLFFIVAMIIKGISSSGSTGSYSRSNSPRSPSPSPAANLTRTPASPGVREINFGSFPVANWLARHGWVHDGHGVYRGDFVAQGHRIRGEVHYRAGEFELLLHRPPGWATGGSHSSCWHDRPGGWQFLHLNVSPGNVVEAIVGCQAFLSRKLEENAA